MHAFFRNSGPDHAVGDFPTDAHDCIGLHVFPESDSRTERIGYPSAVHQTDLGVEGFEKCTCGSRMGVVRVQDIHVAQPALQSPQHGRIGGIASGERQKRQTFAPQKGGQSAVGRAGRQAVIVRVSASARAR